MDVSCPRCRTEYELEDSRVPEEGVTVKCTQCAHVFRVKKKALVVTLPVKPEEAANAQSVGSLPPAATTREWKVRQLNGNIFTCRELTTLQKWIVEGKIMRDDEISLSGDTWKRLGNIPELASFFQVVEEAQRARALEALRTVSNPNLPAITAPNPGAPGLTDTWREAQFKVPIAPVPELVVPPPAPPVTAPPQVQAPVPPPPAPAARPQEITQPHVAFNPKETQRQQQFSVPPPPMHYAPPKRIEVEEDDDELERKARGGSGGRWAALILLGLAAGGGAGYYFGVYVPDQERKAVELKAEERAREEKAREDAAKAEREGFLAGERKAAEERAAAEALAAAKADAGPPDAGPPDAGPVDAGVADAGVQEKPNPKRSFDNYVAQGDRLRDREKPEAALDMYGRAADIFPERVEPIAGRGLALLDMGQVVPAEASFEAALKLNPRYGPAIMGLAEAFRMQGKKDSALQWYQKYLDVLPDGSEAEVARSNIERLKK
jgi:predicted Zn finger-like uncharacterized protein